MRQFHTFLLLTFGVSAMFAQHPARGGHAVTMPAGRQVANVQFGSGRKMLKPRATTSPRAVAPAPGVVQVHYEEGQVFAYFIATSAIPSGSQEQVSLTIDDGSGNPSSLTFDPITGPFNVGDYITLPSLSNMGDLQPQYLVTYTVDVSSGRAVTEANGFFLVGTSLGYSDFTNFAPVITGVSQKILPNKDMVLVINGVFTTDTPLVVIESLVPPATAITRVSNSEIDVDLSQTPGIDLTSLSEYLLSVSQAGFADTIVWRYVPAADNTYNPAPSQ